MADMFRIAERASLKETARKSEKTDAYSFSAPGSEQKESLNMVDLLDFSSKDFLKSFILSEVLGKPKAMRKVR